jgi:DnaK suppressor protein
MIPRGGHRLSPEQRKTLHERLASRAAVLREEIAAALHPQEASTAGMADPREATDDEAVADAQAALDVAGLERDSAELREIEAAARRLESPSFGTCMDCGVPIAWDRLMAVPHALRCARCQTAAESSLPRPTSI